MRALVQPSLQRSPARELSRLVSARGALSRSRERRASVLAIALTIASVLFARHVALAQDRDEEASTERGASADDADEGGSSDADDDIEWPGERQGPVYATWWFWTAIGAVVLGVTLAIVIGLTTEDPASAGRRAGLVIRF